ncbi:MAG TPA: type II secretion system F family protein [Bryobacteraceae bacterium]|nr:type II secretion system F family protein [Bryobacteraceae bacterium]
MNLLVSVALFGLLVTAISAYGYGRYAKPARMLRQLDPEPAPAATLDRIGQREPSRLSQKVQAIGKHAPISPQDAQTARRTLIAAGYRAESAVAMLYGIKLILAVVLAILSIVFRDNITANPVLRIVLPIAATVGGYWLPGFLLERKVSKRQEKLRLALPDGLDLMVVSVEAGLGLDQALQNVGRELAVAHPELSDELSLVTLEMRAGKRRAEALRNLAQRTGEPELRKLTAILIQSDRFGTSMAEALRTHSEFMRVRRRQEAEERAAKVGVKLVFPIFFFILPSILVVAAGPGILQVFKYLFPLMKGIR